MFATFMGSYKLDCLVYHMEHPSHTSAADMLAVDVQYLSRRDLVAAFGAGRRQVEGFGVDAADLAAGNKVQ